MRARSGPALVALGAALVVTALLACWWAASSGVRGGEVYVVGDGRPHAVASHPGRTYTVWYADLETKACTVTSRIGESLDEQPVVDGATREDGVVEWVATDTVVADGDELRVSCTGYGRPPTGGLVTAAGPGLLSVVLRSSVALTLLAAGLAALWLAAAARRARGRDRDWTLATS